MRRSSGTNPGLRERLPWPGDRPFRILSIDGGGIRGILPAAVLAEFERRHLGGRSAGDYFDLIAGTSTGGIIALGLSIGLPASRILNLYVEHGGEVFPPIRPPFRRLKRGLWRIRGLGTYRYEREPLARHLRTVFKGITVGEARRRLCVPAFDGFTEVFIFKTPHHCEYRMDWREEMVTVALATAAAPTYFAVYKDRGRYFADGGVWANNPVMIALVDALACHDIDRRQVHILSLGCGDSELRITERQIVRGGIWHWCEIIEAAMRLQGRNADGQAGLLVGRDHLVRIDGPAMPEDPIALDDHERARDELIPIASRLADEFDERVRERFLGKEAEPFVAWHGPRAGRA